MLLEIKNLTVSLSGKILLDNISLSIEANKRHLLSGHNGSGKSTLVQTIAGNPDYKIDTGEIIFDGKDITNMDTTDRALNGIFLGAQNVPEIPGLSIITLLKHSMAAHRKFRTGSNLIMKDFFKELEEARSFLDIPKEWLNRSINLGFSGGERKKIMLLRLLLTSPKLAILDEPDSGADSKVQEKIVEVMNKMKETTFLFISHQETFTKLVNPQNITVLSCGKILI